MLKRICVLFSLMILPFACKVRNGATGTDDSRNSERPRTASDVEIIDTISIELDDTVPVDSLITPGMPLVNRWPMQYECFDGHFVIFTDSLSPKVAELTLMSLTDWAKIMSSYSETPEAASDTAAHYVEFGLAGWTIPTETMARRMKDELTSDEMNVELAAMYGDEIRVTEGSSNARYLCEKAEKTFSFAENTKITKAGAKTKYRLRLVQTIRVARI